MNRDWGDINVPTLRSGFWGACEAKAGEPCQGMGGLLEEFGASTIGLDCSVLLGYAGWYSVPLGEFRADSTWLIYGVLLRAEI